MPCVYSLSAAIVWLSRTSVLTTVQSVAVKVALARSLRALLIPTPCFQVSDYIGLVLHIYVAYRLNRKWVSEYKVRTYTTPGSGLTYLDCGQIT